MEEREATAGGLNVAFPSGPQLVPPAATDPTAAARCCVETEPGTTRSAGAAPASWGDEEKTADTVGLQDATLNSQQVKASKRKKSACTCNMKPF